MRVKKKLLGSILVMVLTAFLALAGCSSKGSSGDAGGSGDVEEQEKYKIIMTHELPETFPKHIYMAKFKDIVEEKSEGRLEVIIHSGGQLFKDGEAVQALGTGSVHMVWPISGHLEALNEQYGIVSLPFGLKDQMMLENPEFRKNLTGLLSSFVEDKGIKVFGLMRSSEGIILSADKELKGLSDLEGMKIRTVSGHVASDMIASFKGTSISMPSTELATSLSQGAIDGVNTSPEGWRDVVGSVAKYGLVVPQMQIHTYSIVADKVWFDQLPEDLQTLIEETLDEVIVAQWEESMAADKKIIESVEADWGTNHYIPENEIEEWKQATEVVWEKFGERQPEALQQFNELIESAQ